jgi:hypothetical protein
MQDGTEFCLFTASVANFCFLPEHITRALDMELEAFIEYLPLYFYCGKGKVPVLN